MSILGTLSVPDSFDCEIHKPSGYPGTAAAVPVAMGNLLLIHREDSPHHTRGEYPLSLYRGPYNQSSVLGLKMQVVDIYIRGLRLKVVVPFTLVHVGDLQNSENRLLKCSTSPLIRPFFD